jgi:cytochrome c553
LNGFAIWVTMMIALTVVNYGFPIAQLVTLKETSVPAVAHRRAVMAAPHDPASRRYVQWSVISLVALTLVTLLVGFVWLPSMHADFSAQGIWAAICRDGPASRRNGANPPSPRKRASPRASSCRMSRRSGTSKASIGLGATLALQQCTMCHGAQGVTAADTPNLAGQYRK